MKPTRLLTCPNPKCHKRFPVNTSKHTNRKERFCPYCHTPIQIRKSLKNWRPNLNWTQQKEEQQAQRQQEKLVKRQKKEEQSPYLF